MQFNDIDNGIKKGLMQYSQQDEAHAREAKSRVWAAIDKPRRKHTVHWGFISAVAASTSLFVICSMLYLKLASREKALEELQSHITFLQQPASEPSSVTPPHDGQEVQQTHSAIFEVPPVSMPEKNSSKHHGNHPAEHKNGGYPEALAPQPVAVIPIPELNLPQILPEDARAELILPEQVQEQIQPDLKPKNSRKLKVKLGNSSHSQDHGHALALSIKL